VANLPTVSSPLPRDLQQFVQRVREVLDGEGEDAVVTTRQLIASGLAESRRSGRFSPVGGAIDPARASRNLSASGALASIILSWDAPNYNGHAYAEVWAHTADVLGDAVLVGMTAGNSFAHTLGVAATRYYWVRNINQNGVASAYNATNGTQGSTGQDPAYLLTILNGEITSSQLATELSTRIDLIDGASTVSGSVNERIESQVTNSLALKADASTVTTLAATVNVNTAAITSEATTRATADTSLASDITTLQTTVGGFTTSIQTNATAVNGLEGQYTVKIDNNGAVAGYGLASTTTVAGNITSEFIVNADRFGIMRGGSDTTAAVAPFVVQTTATTLNGETVPVGVYIADAFIKNGTITNAKIGDAAIDSAKIADATIVGADIANATIQGANIATATITSANIADATITSANIADATIQEADIANAAITTAKIEDLAVTSAKFANAAITNAKIANAAVSAAKIQDLAVTNAKIGDAAITAAKIQDLAVTSAKIGDLSASKITSGIISAARFIGAGIANVGSTSVNISAELGTTNLSASISGLQSGTRLIGIAGISGYKTNGSRRSFTTTASLSGAGSSGSVSTINGVEEQNGVYIGGWLGAIVSGVTTSTGTATLSVTISRITASGAGGNTAFKGEVIILGVQG
jgi:uncharacterized protein YjbI with pentapeptide repeats